MATEAQPKYEDGISEAAACEIVRQWAGAFNRRDVDALVALADPEIEFHPSILVGARRTYVGHDGLRRWVEDVKATHIEHTVEISRARRSSSGDVVLTGKLFAGGKPVGPFSMRFRLRGGRVIDAASYLSEESVLIALGHIDAD
jgi:ketosteroid isomerase-like protein